MMGIDPVDACVKHGHVNSKGSIMDVYEETTGMRASLTDAEIQVLKWVRAGRTNREIGRILCKSEFTVKTHVQRMLAKTGVDNRLQLALLAQSA
jgi:DNA-binding CsgD family transcriptional regulator